MADRQIDWTSAEVKGAKLTVGVNGEGEGAKQWSARVQSVLHVLDRSGGRWGEIKVAKDKIEVADLREGAEPELRHLLESAVLQANADLAPDSGEDDKDAGDEQDGDDEERSGDAQMTDAFRSFASESDDEDEGDGEDGDGKREDGKRDDGKRDDDKHKARD